MLQQFTNLTDLLLTFNTETKCVEYLEQMRWNGKPVCPHCGHERAYRTSAGYKCASNACYKKFTVKVGTVFEASNIKLQKWFCAVYLFTAHKKGISSHQLARDLGVSQKTAWFMLHRVRELFRDKAPQVLKGEIEADETLIGGDRTNMHKVKRDARLKQYGTGHGDKAKVFGMVERGGNVKAFAIAEATQATILPLIQAHTQQGATMFTDTSHIYKPLKATHAHGAVNHGKGEFVRGAIHTNTIENYWGSLKRGIYGIYHQVSPKHLQRYCDEFAYRYNSRTITDNTRFSLSLTQAEGRLTYKQLVYGEKEESGSEEKTC